MIQGVPGGKVNILRGHSIGHSKKNIYMNMCPISNGFPYLARNIFIPYLSMSSHNSQLTLHTDSRALDIGALQWEGREILRAKLKILRQISETVRNRTHVHINFLFFRMTDKMASHSIDLSSWDSLYIYNVFRN
jgi:hypothetical protein